MEIIALILVAVALFGGFVLLTMREARYGFRLILPDARAALDATVFRFLLVVTHEDFSSYVRHKVVTAAHRIAHDVTHGFLVAIRATERFLTRLVRYLRDRKTPSFAEPKTSSTFIRHISEFKQSLRLRREAHADTSVPKTSSAD